MKITHEQRMTILSMVLGDGSLNSNGYFVLRHGLKQKEYLDWKYNLLKNKFKLTDIYYHDNNGYGSYEFRTKNYRFLKLYRKIFYGTGRKNMAKRKFLNKLTAQSIAIWYMDDGSLIQKRKDGKVHANELYINTYVSKEENQVYIDYFKEVWDIQFSNALDKGKYRLRCSTKEARKFVEIVRPYVSQVNCMVYKLNVRSSEKLIS